MRNYHRQTDWARHSLQVSSPIGAVARGHAREARERGRSTKGAKERDSLQQSEKNFHFHPGNHRKPQSVKTVTGNNNNVSAVCQLP